MDTITVKLVIDPKKGRYTVFVEDQTLFERDVKGMTIHGDSERARSIASGLKKMAADMELCLAAFNGGME